MDLIIALLSGIPMRKDRAVRDSHPRYDRVPFGPSILIPLASILLASILLAWSSPSLADDFRVTPPEIQIARNFAQVQLLVQSVDANGQVSQRARDLTSSATFASSSPEIATVDRNGRVLGHANGTATIDIVAEGIVKHVPVVVSGIVSNPALDFHDDILPVLSRSGCNAGACHASQYGKGGFTLSVMGFDPNLDYNSMVLSSRSRRVDPAQPDESLILRKATQSMVHGGGVRFEKDSNAYHIMAQWIASGASRPKGDPIKVTKLSVTPKTHLGSIGDRQQYRVDALYSNGTARDVTAWARFDSMDEGVVSVNSDGLATAVGRGEAPVMIRFAEHAEIASMIVPFSEAADLSNWQDNNVVDIHARTKFVELGITPSPRCDDPTFLRRAFLDATGSLPTVAESKAFLESTDPNKRVQLVDRLLGLTGDPALDSYNERYAALWSLKWADLIRNNSTVLGESGMWALHNWLKESFRTNKPMDRFAQELITAKGSIFSNGPANYYRIANNPSDLAESTSQLFLGTRLQCAKCHHHPYERYSQADYYGFAAFFSRVGTKASAEFGTFGGESVVMVNSGGEVAHPKTGAIMKPTPLEGEPVEDAEDRRVPLAAWMTSPTNDMFARNMVNRYVAYLLGRGLVEPVDDLRSTNPPSNGALMDALVSEFRANRFDVKQLMRTIMNSRLYQLDSQPSANNADDRRFYSHFRVKRIGAEPLLDCIDAATGSLTKHPNLPLGTRATELPDANTQNAFLVTFGKPKRASVCECERSPDENLSQALHTLNGDIVATKVADPKGRIAMLVDAKRSVDECVDELFLASLCRFPSESERSESIAFVTSCPSPTEGLQDLLWALMNSKSFLFIR